MGSFWPKVLILGVKCRGQRPMTASLDHDVKMFKNVANGVALPKIQTAISYVILGIELRSKYGWKLQNGFILSIKSDISIVPDDVMIFAPIVHFTRFFFENSVFFNTTFIYLKSYPLYMHENKHTNKGRH